jgi:tetratricopeptide (TPR) repeat protein
VLDKRPASAEAHHYRGRAMLLKGGTLLADALQELKRAVELDPNRAAFHVYVARAANEMAPAQLELARDEVNRALELDKLDGDAYWQRGVLERMEGAVEDAIKDEKRALELRPSRHEAYATLAECFEDRNDPAAAMAAWAKALSSEPKPATPDELVAHPLWHYRFGKLLWERNDRASAAGHFAVAVAAGEKLELRPAWLAAAEFLDAEALRAAGRKADAIEHYKRFLEIAPVTSPDRVDAQRALQDLGGAAR